MKDTIPDTFRGSDHCFVWYAGLEEADPLKSDNGKQNERYGGNVDVIMLLNMYDVFILAKSHSNV